MLDFKLQTAALCSKMYVKCVWQNCFVFLFPILSCHINHVMTNYNLTELNISFEVNVLWHTWEHLANANITFWGKEVNILANSCLFRDPAATEQPCHLFGVMSRET